MGSTMVPQNNRSVRVRLYPTLEFVGSREDIVPIESFEEMGIKEELLPRLRSLGFSEPSAIQKLAINPILDGSDVIIMAQSGSGKSAVVALTVGTIVESYTNELQALILSPTEELASRMKQKLMCNSPRIRVYSYEKNDPSDLICLRDSHVWCVTPERLREIIKLKLRNTESVRILFLDDSDDMLRMGFEDVIRKVYSSIRQTNLQICVISATYPYVIRKIESTMMDKPVKFFRSHPDLTLMGIEQYAVLVKETTRRDKLFKLIDALQDNIQYDVLVVEMRKKYKVSAICGTMIQTLKDESMTEFHNFQTYVLITTDVWVHDIDPNHVSCVIHYNLPRDPGLYLYRIGRSGRFIDRKGISIILHRSNEHAKVDEIRNHETTVINQMKLAEMLIIVSQFRD